MTRIIIATFVVALTALLSPMLASAATYDNGLRWWVHNSLEVASWQNGSETKRVPKKVYVQCYANRYEFERRLAYVGESPYRTGFVIAYHMRGTSTVHMRAGTCNLARDFVNGRVTQDSAGAFKTLLHEAIHVQDVLHLLTERETEMHAIAVTRWAAQLVEWNRRINSGAVDQDLAWENSAAWGLRAMRLAWQQSQRYIARSYLASWTSVQSLARRENWADAV